MCLEIGADRNSTAWSTEFAKPAEALAVSHDSSDASLGHARLQLGRGESAADQNSRPFGSPEPVIVSTTARTAATSIRRL